MGKVEMRRQVTHDRIGLVFQVSGYDGEQGLARAVRSDCYTHQNSDHCRSRRSRRWFGNHAPLRTRHSFNRQRRISSRLAEHIGTGCDQVNMKITRTRPIEFEQCANLISQEASACGVVKRVSDSPSLRHRGRSCRAGASFPRPPRRVWGKAAMSAVSYDERSELLTSASFVRRICHRIPKGA